MMFKTRKNSCENSKMSKKPVNFGLSKLKYLLGKYRLMRLKRISSKVKKVIPALKPKTGVFRKPFTSQKNSLLIKEDFQLGKLLGTGGFGSVYMANGKFGDGPLAIKVMNKPSMSKNPVAMMESFKAELRCLELCHPNIVQSFGATPMSSFEEGAWVVMEYAGSHTLQTLLNNTNSALKMDKRLQISTYLARGLKYLHRNNIVHLDIKPANILITPDGNCKIGDLGCSQILEANTGRVSPTQRSSLTGTFAYRAPELLRGEPPTKKADIYSFGITLWQMLAAESPYGNENQHVVIFGVVAYGHRPGHPDVDENDLPELCYRDLYSQSWDVLPVNRPSADDLVEVLDIWRDNL